MKNSITWAGVQNRFDKLRSAQAGTKLRARLLSSTSGEVDRATGFAANSIDPDGLCAALGLAGDASPEDIIAALDAALPKLKATFGLGGFEVEDADPTGAMNPAKGTPSVGAQAASARRAALRFDAAAVLSPSELQACREAGANPETYLANKLARAARNGGSR